jgi:hypothetical protein
MGSDGYEPFLIEGDGAPRASDLLDRYTIESITSEYLDYEGIEELESILANRLRPYCPNQACERYEFSGKRAMLVRDGGGNSLHCAWCGHRYAIGWDFDHDTGRLTTAVIETTSTSDLAGFRSRLGRPTEAEIKAAAALVRANFRAGTTTSGRVLCLLGRHDFTRSPDPEALNHCRRCGRLGGPPNPPRTRLRMVTPARTGGLCWAW